MNLLLLIAMLLSSLNQTPPVMWDAGNSTAFNTVVAGVQNYPIYSSQAATGTYSHHPQITRDQNTFFTMWSHGKVDEDSPGQYVMASLSPDGTTWGNPFTIFPGMDTQRNFGVGRILTAITFVKLDQGLYAIADVFDWVINLQGEYERKGYGRIARLVDANGTMGEIFWMTDQPPAPISGFPKYGDMTNQSNAKIAKQITDKLNNPYRVPPHDFKNYANDAITPEGGTSLETTYPYKREMDNALIKFGRDTKSSLRLYSQTSYDNGVTWSTPIKTGIPDSETMTRIGTLPDGRIYMVGTQIGQLWNRSNLTLSKSDDGITFKPVGSIRNDFVPQRFVGKSKGSVGGNSGFAYPDITIVDNDLWIIYSIGKEDISVTKVPISSIH